MQKRGTLNVGLRLEWLFARQALQIASAAGAKNAKFKDYIRHHERWDADEDKPVQLTTPEQFAALFGARKKER